MATEKKEPEKKTDPWGEMVSIKLFKDNGNYKDDVFVSVNGRNYQIQRGKTVQVPHCVAEVLEHSERQDQAAALMVDELEREYGQHKK